MRRASAVLVSYFCDQAIQNYIDLSETKPFVSILLSSMLQEYCDIMFAYTQAESNQAL